MFDSLDERIKQDHAQETTPKERAIWWIGVCLGSVLLFGGLYFGIRLLE